MDTVELERMRAVIIQQLDESLGSLFAGTRKVAIETMGEWTAYSMAVRLVQDILGRKLEQVEHTYPADWWQAFKARWFPAWAKRRWPVRETRVVLTARELYPKIALPDREWYISLDKKVRPVEEDGGV